MPGKRQKWRGFTLVELITALVIIAILSVAVGTLVLASGETTAFVKNSANTVTDVDNACRRMAFNLRMASSLDSPTNSTPTNTFTIKTQLDSGAAHVVSYQVDSSNNLTEIDGDRFGTTTLVKNVTAFTVTRVTTTAPSKFTITLTAGTSPSVTRTFTVLSRNL
jgi:prepilin-type N-terminal cleavage/methylation domain-containing protein